MADDPEVESVVESIQRARSDIASQRSVLVAFHDLDVVVLEGIYLLKRDFRHIADLAFWVECSFQTALDRAIRRAQEGLSTEDTIEAYQRIYFPAQRIHFQRDDPKTFAKALIHNQTD